MIRVDELQQAVQEENGHGALRVAIYYFTLAVIDVNHLAGERKYVHMREIEEGFPGAGNGVAEARELTMLPLWC